MISIWWITPILLFGYFFGLITATKKPALMNTVDREEPRKAWKIFFYDPAYIRDEDIPKGMGVWVPVHQAKDHVRDFVHETEVY